AFRPSTPGWWLRSCVPEHGSDRPAAAAQRVLTDQLFLFGHLSEQRVQTFREDMLLEIEIRLVGEGQLVVGAQQLPVLIIEANLPQIGLNDRLIAPSQACFGL